MPKLPPPALVTSSLPRARLLLLRLLPYLLSLCPTLFLDVFNPLRLFSFSPSLSLFLSFSVSVWLCPRVSREVCSSCFFVQRSSTFAAWKRNSTSYRVCTADDTRYLRDVARPTVVHSCVYCIYKHLSIVFVSRSSSPLAVEVEIQLES